MVISSHTASELDFSSALTNKDHRGYAVVRLSPMIEVVEVTSIPPTGYDVCSTIGLIIDWELTQVHDLTHQHRCSAFTSWSMDFHKFIELADTQYRHDFAFLGCYSIHKCNSMGKAVIKPND